MIKTMIIDVWPYLVAYLLLGAVYFGFIFRRYKEVRDASDGGFFLLSFIVTLIWPFLLGCEAGEALSDKLVEP